MGGVRQKRLGQAETGVILCIKNPVSLTKNLLQVLGGFLRVKLFLGCRTFALLCELVPGKCIKFPPSGNKKRSTSIFHH